MESMPPVAERTVSATYQLALARYPDKAAHLGDGQAWTFTESQQRSLRIAAGLAALGVGRQQTVGLFLDSSIDYIQAWLGVGLGGYVGVPVNTAYKGRFLAHVLRDAGVRVLVIEAGYAGRLPLVLDELPALDTIVVRGDGAVPEEVTRRLNVISFDELSSHDPVSPEPNKADELVAIMYTSGTTGLSKGVLTTHAHLYTYVAPTQPSGLTPDDRALVALPLFHLAGVGAVFGPLIAGCACVLAPSFSPSRFWPFVREHGITSVPLLGAMSEMLQQQPPQADDADNPLRIAIMSPVPTGLDAFCRRFGIQATTAYGMSEIGRVTDGDPDDLRPGEAGQARPGYRLRIVDAEGKDVPDGAVGELWVLPEHPLAAMQGYHNLPDKTAEIIVDGWLRTGDAFRVDADGHYFFVDRIKDALRRRGENISSFEVEAVINEHPAVLESAVVAVPSDLLEDEIKAVIVPRDGQPIDPVELTGFLIDRMPYFMVPRYVEFAAELPKTPTQKVLKHVLRDRGVAVGVWDREAAGIILRRDGRRLR
jgi:carnitine-CoA ligase